MVDKPSDTPGHAPAVRNFGFWMRGAVARKLGLMEKHADSIKISSADLKIFWQNHQKSADTLKLFSKFC